MGPSNVSITSPRYFKRAQKKLILYYQRLFEYYGPQYWWPAVGSHQALPGAAAGSGSIGGAIAPDGPPDSKASPLEVIVGAILTQNTAWRNVERAIENLKREGLLNPEALHRISVPKLALLIRPSGYFNIKTERLKAFIRFLFEEYEGLLEKMFQEGPSVLRQKLLNIKGIGPETADSILLYAGGVPVFVVDAYTHRILYRHGIYNRKMNYHDIQARFVASLPQDLKLYGEYHALMVRVGKEYCRRQPHCRGCPLEGFLDGKAIVK